MDIELFLLLSSTYEYTAEPTPQGWHKASPKQLRDYIKGGIETYMRKQGYNYDAEKHEWDAKERREETARRRTQGAKDGWEIRRGKQGKRT